MARITDATRRVEEAVDRGRRLAALQTQDREQAAAAEFSRAQMLHDLAVRLADGVTAAEAGR